jgi:hypothetical protein
METQMGENHGMIFLYIKIIHSLEAPTSQFSSYNYEGGYEPPIYRLQPKGSYNSLNYLVPTRRRLQPPDSMMQEHHHHHSMRHSGGQLNIQRNTFRTGLDSKEGTSL